MSLDQNAKVSLTSRKLVVESWNLIKNKINNYQMVAGVLLFRNIFSTAPQVKEMFEFAKGKDDEEITRSPSFAHHAQKVVTELDKTIQLLISDDNTLALSQMLTDLGNYHGGLGVERDHFIVVGQALLKTISTALGEDFKPEVEQAWIETYEFISGTMIAGGQSGEDR